MASDLTAKHVDTVLENPDSMCSSALIYAIVTTIEMHIALSFLRVQSNLFHSETEYVRVPCAMIRIKIDLFALPPEREKSSFMY